MKMVSIAVAGLGVLSLVMGIVGKFVAHPILDVSPGGYLRFATALYLLALVVMAYDRCYNCCSKTPTPPSQ